MFRRKLRNHVGTSETPFSLCRALSSFIFSCMVQGRSQCGLFLRFSGISVGLIIVPYVVHLPVADQATDTVGGCSVARLSFC